MARQVSAAPINGTVPRISPVAGLFTSMVAPLSASHQRPPMNAWRRNRSGSRKENDVRVVILANHSTCFADFQAKAIKNPKFFRATHAAARAERCRQKPHSAGPAILCNNYTISLLARLDAFLRRKSGPEGWPATKISPNSRTKNVLLDGVLAYGLRMKRAPARAKKAARKWSAAASRGPRGLEIISRKSTKWQIRKNRFDWQSVRLAGRTMSLRISVETFLLEVCLSEASEIGYEGIGVGAKVSQGPQRCWRRSSRSMGFDWPPGGIPGFWPSGLSKRSGRQPQNHVQLLKGCGSRVLVYGEDGKMPSLDLPLSQSPELDSIDLPDYAKKVREFSERLRQEGVVLAYHHHLMMLVEKAEEIVAFCEATGDKVGLLLDTGHAYAAGADYGQIIQKFGNRIVHIHLKDVRGKVLASVRERDLSFNAAVREGLFTVPGDGDLDFCRGGCVCSNIRVSGLGGGGSRARSCQGGPAKRMRRRPSVT